MVKQNEDRNELWSTIDSIFKVDDQDNNIDEKDYAENVVDMS